MKTETPQMDWQQVVLNGGPPCFYVETNTADGHPRYCGRAERWQGHGAAAFHDFVSLDAALTTVQQEARAAAFREAFTIQCVDCAEGNEPTHDTQARWFYHGEGREQVGCSASKLRLEAAANSVPEDREGEANETNEG